MRGRGERTDLAGLAGPSPPAGRGASLAGAVAAMLCGLAEPARAGDGVGPARASDGAGPVRTGDSAGPARASDGARPVGDGAEPVALRQAAQLLLVTAPGWDSIEARAQRFERRPGGPWRPVGAAFPVRLGRGGLGWRSDDGAPPPPAAAPVKREGDGRSPAGVLALGDLWGYAATAPTGAALPYHAATAVDRCVDDAAAADYGRLVTAPSAAPPPWRSAEEMRRQDDLYKHLIVVRYNMDRPRRGAGSCIFLHLWGPAKGPTAGCTAMAEEDLLRLARWLRPAAHPVMVQLPTEEHARLRVPWALP